MQQGTDFDELLTSGWNKLYISNHHLFRVNLKFVHQWDLKDSPFHGYYDKQLVENKRETQISLQPVTESQDIIPLIADFNPDKFNFTEVEPEEILFYLDLEGNGGIITPDEKTNQQNEGINVSHPLLINNAPICRRHCILPLFIDQQLPQVISGHLVQLASSVFLITKNATLRIGYNSVGAFASVNHLHFQLLYAEDLFPQFKMFPVERFPRTLLFETELKTTENVYQIGVQVNTLQAYPVRTLLLQPLKKPQTVDEVVAAQQSLAAVFQVLIELLFEKKIPHNLMIADQGLSIYIYPRQSQQLHFHDHEIKPAWVELGGLAIVRNKELQEKITSEWFDTFLKEKCSLNEDEFNELAVTLKQNIAVKFP